MADDHQSLEARLFTPGALLIFGGLLLACYVMIITFGVTHGAWLTGQGPGRQLDFLVFWVAGDLALHGNAAAAYDWATVGVAQFEVVGNSFTAYPWVYPPTFLLMVAPFALLPFVPAFVAWMMVTLIAYLAVIRSILPRGVAVFLALVSPPVFWNVYPGQNGFLTAALLGGALICLDTRQVLSGVLLGFLTYKPQFGLLFPLVIVLTGRWRVFLAAALTAFLLVVVSVLAFGATAWENFLTSGPGTIDAVFSGSLVPWAKLQSVYSFVRWLGGGVGIATATHAVVALATMAIVCAIWLRPIAYSLQAAALAAGALVMTPRLFIYDMTAIAVPVAFFVQAALEDGFRRGERSILVAIAVVLLALGWGVAPLGWLLPLGLLGLTLARTRLLIASGGARLQD
jgi:arabinofuranan 3-O-arabinosyltransferase